MPIHRTRTLENLSASSFSFSSKDSRSTTGSKESRPAPHRPTVSPSSRSTEKVTDETHSVKRLIPDEQTHSVQRNVGVPLQTGLTIFFATTNLEPKVDPKVQPTSRPSNSVATKKRAPRKSQRKVLHVNTNLPMIPGEGVEGEENEIEDLLLGPDHGARRSRTLLHGKTPKGIKRRRSDISTPTPQLQEGGEVRNGRQLSLLEELEGEGGDSVSEAEQEVKKDQERPRKLLRVHGDNGTAAVTPQLDVTTGQGPVLVYPDVYVLEMANFNGDQKSKWTHIIHIETCKDKQGHSNFRDEKDVHHIHIYISSSGSSPLSLKDAQLRAGRDFLSLALPYSCSQAEDSHSFTEPPASWIDQRWETEPSRVLILFDSERLRDVLALVATFGVFDGAGTVEEFMEHFMDAFPESTIADAARDIWEDWRTVEKLKRAGSMDMIKKPLRKLKSAWKMPVYGDEWE